MLAMSASTDVVANCSPNALAVGLWDGQQLELMSSSPGSNGDYPMNPLLLASVCFGSSGALSYLFSREDAQKPPMIMPAPEFLDLLTPASSTRTRLTVPQASGDVEDGVAQPNCLPAAALLLKGVTAQGDTALHAVAGHGDSPEFLKCASIINERDQHLLFAVNAKGDTPLHCAARAGNHKMVSYLIKLAAAASRNGLRKLLRKENNGRKETALHDAVRSGNEYIVELLLEADPELAHYPAEDASPLYLAILLERDSIARALHDITKGNLSYHGPGGQNALHAAILRGAEMTKDVLKWNNSLTTQVDKDGSTPLHFASSLHRRLYRPLEDDDYIIPGLWHSDIFMQVFNANPAPVYQADNKGSFPIHIAASLGAKSTIGIILEKCPSSAGLRDAQGKTFLHIAVQYKRLKIVSFACRTPSLAWILNMKDNDGNTAMHLAVKVGWLRIFASLYGNKEVHLSLINNNGQTPLDLSRSLIPRGMHYSQNSEKKIYVALIWVDAKHSGLRWDQIYEKYSQPMKPEDNIKEAERVKDASQLLGIGSVLIATVAFGATFAVPGGYKADDHTNGGTPTLSGRYTFDAFMIATALAFICSSIATTGLMFSGISMVNLRSRQINLATSEFFMGGSLTCLSTAFALGVYIMLAPVSHATAIAICVFSPLVVLCRHCEYLVKWAILARPLCIRLKPITALTELVGMIFSQMQRALWPFILIFGLAAIARKLRDQ
ncbi:hypothetical protein ZWY2020_032094 [Hordeum vulgare]|nr:hypothetical protein ZWY2020_032094 [Hordeum vulgare]